MENKELITLLKERFGFTDKEVESKRDEILRILYLNKDIIARKAQFYMQEFNLSKDEFIKILKVSPSLLAYKEDSAKAKKEFYMQEFNLSKEEFGKMLKALPTLLGLNEDSVKAKKEFYMQEFNLSKEEFAKMLKISPALLSYKENSVKSKHKAMKELGIDDREVIKNPAFFTAPENSLKVKYMILYIASNSDSFMERINWQMTSHKKTWARLSWIREIGYEKIKFGDIIDREKNFIKKFKIDSGRLMEKFPFTKEAVSQINAEYEEIAKRTGGLELKLSKNDFERGK